MVGFLSAALGGRSRVLEVGCGRGEVARRLGAAGWQVTALDRELPDRTPAAGVAFVEHDFLDYDAPPFDAAVFTSSLHHIAPLPAAIDRAHALVAPGGLLVADEFALEAPDAATLDWYYDAQELLAAADLIPRDRIDEAAADPADRIERWMRAHHHEPALHTGAAMQGAIAARFELRDVRGGAYLYRYPARNLPGDARGLAIAAHLCATEQAGIAAGRFAAVGLRIAAVRR